MINSGSYSDIIVIVKLLFSIAFVIAMIVGSLWLQRKQVLSPKNEYFLLATGVFLRLAIFIVAFVILDIPFSSDMKEVRYDMARAIHEGKLPYEDVNHDYGPLFPYLFVSGVDDNYHDSAVYIAFICTVLEILSFCILWRLISIGASRDVLLRWLVLYVLCPLPYLYSVLSHQDETWPIGIYALALLFLLTIKNQRLKALIAGAIIAVGGLFTKTTTALPLGLMFGFTALYNFFIAGMLLVGGVFLLLFWQIFPGMYENLSSPTWPDNPSIWYLPQILTGNDHWVEQHMTIPSLLTFILTLTTGLTFAYFAQKHHLYVKDRATQIHYFMYTWITIWLVFSLITPKGNANYVLFWMPAAIFLLAVNCSKRMLFVIAVFTVISGVHSSVSYRWLPVQRYTDLTDQIQLTVLFLDLIMYLSYIIILWFTIKQMYAEFEDIFRIGNTVSPVLSEPLT